MILDPVPFSRAQPSGNSHFKQRALSSFIAFLEKRLGGSFVYDSREIPFNRDDLVEPLALAALLKKAGVADIITPARTLSDEPPMKKWSVRLAHAKSEDESWSRGCDATNDTQALYAALSEALERHIWSFEKDYFDSPIEATEVEMQKRHMTFLSPSIFAGFGPSQRAENPHLDLQSDAKYLWIRGISLISGKKVYLPAQTVCGVHLNCKEPLIRPRVTTGLATWPNKAGARVRGALEALARDAFMILWANQLVLPRLSLNDLRSRSASLRDMVERCKRYRLKVHAVRLLTDAPTHVASVILEDMSGNAPRFTIGNKAGANLASCVEHALFEALGARLTYRFFFLSQNWKERWDPKTPAERIGHMDRLYWWGESDNAKNLEFLIAGDEGRATESEWEHDTDEEHGARIVEWCRARGYECVSVALGASKSNPTSLFVETVVVPQLQPLHLVENQQALFGARLGDIPRMFGYTPRQKSFSESPHPFC